MAKPPYVSSVEFEGKVISFESGHMARQAHGSAVVRLGNTVVFSAVCYGGESRLGFFPLMCDYREMRYAAGKFPGGFFKREGRPTTKEILSCRLIDRPIRPQFPQGFKREVAVSARVFSVDFVNEPDVLAMNGAMLATQASGLPFSGPLGATRVGRVGGKFVAFPTTEELEKSDLDLVVAASESAICMVEAGAKEVSEDVILEALDFAHDVIRRLIKAQKKILKHIQRPALEFTPKLPNEALYKKWKRSHGKKLERANKTAGKHERREAIRAVRDAIFEKLGIGSEDCEIDEKEAKDVFEKLVKSVVRAQILKEGKRSDGRELDEIRPISCDTAVLPRTHGSALFTRGETQALLAITLGSRRDEQKIDGLIDEPYYKRFILHYNFPAYCVGEAWPNRGPKRREIGHGALAERALVPVLPSAERFPYTIRVVSEIMESNGSSSMATVCGGTLALMDAGVLIRRPVAGIAMGLINEGKKYRILSDILGLEDHCGDMDFKVAGSGAGITALQMDIKVAGIPKSVMASALEQARKGRIHILKEMLKAIRLPRRDLSEYAPRVFSVPIERDRIGTLIGPGGKTIRKIQEDYSVMIDIDESAGRVLIYGKADSKIDRAVNAVRSLTEDVKVGSVYDGKVTSLKDFGAFVELTPGQEGLVHVSELSEGYVERVDDVCSVGDTLRVKVLDVDPLGRIRLTCREVDKQAVDV